MEVTQAALKERAKELFKLMSSTKIPALLICDPKNIYYHTDFLTTSLDEKNPVALAARDKILLIADQRYTESSKALSNNIIKVKIKKPRATLSGILTHALKKDALETLCVEDSVSAHLYTTLQKKMKSVRVVAKTPVTKELRMVKDQYEVGQIRKASEITDRIFEEFLNSVRPGMPEHVLAWKLEVLARKLGADKLAFEPIISSGERAGVINQISSKKKLQSGEMIAVSLGVTVNHYSSNIARTIFLGRPTREFKQRYKVVQRTQEKMLRRVRIGMKWENAYDEAYRLFKKYRFGSNYINGLGHGVGLNNHEAPYISKKVQNGQRFKLGMVFTVAPSLYFPNWGGIKIGDTVVLTKRGSDRLTKTDRNLISLMR